MSKWVGPLPDSNPSMRSRVLPEPSFQNERGVQFIFLRNRILQPLLFPTSWELKIRKILHPCFGDVSENLVEIGRNYLNQNLKACGGIRAERSSNSRDGKNKEWCSSRSLRCQFTIPLHTLLGVLPNFELPLLPASSAKSPLSHFNLRSKKKGKSTFPPCLERKEGNLPSATLPALCVSFIACQFSLRRWHLLLSVRISLAAPRYSDPTRNNLRDWGNPIFPLPCFYWI